MRKVEITAALAILLGWLAWLGCWLAGETARDLSLKANFNQVKYGVSKLDVIRLLGKPDKVLPACDYYTNRPKLGCVEQYVYFGFWFCWLDEAWTVSLGSDGLVQDTGYFFSP